MIVGILFGAAAVVDVAGIIVACATFVTAAVASIILYRQNSRQHASNSSAVRGKIDEAVEDLKEGHSKLGVRFDVHAKESLVRDAELSKGIAVLKADAESTFGMLVGLDATVTRIHNRHAVLDGEALAWTYEDAVIPVKG